MEVISGSALLIYELRRVKVKLAYELEFVDNSEQDDVVARRPRYKQMVVHVDLMVFFREKSENGILFTGCHMLFIACFTMFATKTSVV